MRYLLRSVGISVQQLQQRRNGIACNVGRVGPLRMAR
jgi:hypothetical protein